MPEAPEIAVVRQFRERVRRGDLGAVALTYREPQEGPGAAHAIRELRVAGTRRVQIADRRPEGPPEEADAALRPEELQALYETVVEAADELVPRSQARFLPDSAVGSLRIEVEGQQADLFFLSDERQRAQQSVPLSPKAARSLERLSQTQQRLLRGRGQGGGS
ncbi:MAG: hypothetical protein M3O70_24350 [Actinomycetota bacterium]|nr:hypothetical protein [Actinomycetota bacterium]